MACDMCRAAPRVGVLVGQEEISTAERARQDRTIGRHADDPHRAAGDDEWLVERGQLAPEPRDGEAARDDDHVRLAAAQVPSGGERHAEVGEQRAGRAESPNPFGQPAQRYVKEMGKSRRRSRNAVTLR